VKESVCTAVNAGFHFDERGVAIRRHAALNVAMQDRASTAIVLLAAGEASRFGSPKQIASIGERAMVRHCAINALGTLAPVLVVTGAHRDAVETALGGLHVALVHNLDWQTGMGASIARGVRAARERHPALRGVLIALADQPSISTENLAMLLREHVQTPESIVASRLDAVVGPPCVFPAACFGELERLDGPTGARAVIERHADLCRAVAMPGAAHDIDTREDYRRFVEQAGLPHS
jgi:molybdenum cofactor cytidylyltransferase